MTRAHRPATSLFQRSALWAALSVSMLGSAQALTLAPPVVLSKQGEALVAEADITEATIAEQIDLKASLATPELYQASKVPFPSSNGAPLSLNVQLLQRNNGRPYLKITSQQPVVGNSLDLLIDLRWAGGRMLRDFNVLIEEAQREKKATTPPAVASNSQRSSDKPAIEVKRGDTASELAVNVLSQGISLDQMLLAMLRINPDAFVDNNVNRLKAGVLLSMPTAEEAKQISREDARKEIAVQVQSFEAYRAELAARAPGGVTPKAARDSEGKLQAQVQEQKKKTNQDKLTLAKPGKGSQEEKIAKEREAIDAANKAEALTRSIEELGKIAAATAAASEAGVLPATAPPPTEAASADGSNWVDTLTQHPLAPVGAGGLIAVLVLLGLWARRSGRNHDEPEDHGIQGLPPLNVKFDLNLPHGDDFDGPAARAHHEASHNVSEQTSEDPHHDAHAPSEHLSTDTQHAEQDALHPEQPDASHTHVDALANAPAQTSRPTLDIPNTSHYGGAQEHPFQVRIDLAEELWKLGQLHTSRALMEEVANEASGEIQAQARQWLADRG